MVGVSRRNCSQKTTPFAQSLAWFALRAEKARYTNTPPLLEYGEVHYEGLTVQAANNLNTPTPQGALNLVLTIARKEAGGNGGVSQEQFTAREEEIKQYEAGLERATEAKDEAAISQLTYLLEQKKEALERLRGNV